MKDRILELLLSTDGYLSGEAISKRFGVTRAAVWKWMDQLRREDGVELESHPRQGYKLKERPDLLLPALIREKGLGRFFEAIDHLSIVDSTNNYLKRLAREGVAEVRVAVAEEQNGGKGRLGRGWVSTRGKGVFVSILLRPQLPPALAGNITMMAALAGAKAVGNLGFDAKIKWPNDIVVEGKKICGILTEMSANMDTMEWAVLGMGFNVNQVKEDWPEDLLDKASSLRMLGDGKKVERTALLAALLTEMDGLYAKLEAGAFGEILEEYRKYSATLGKRVRVIDSKGEYTADAVDLDEEGALVVRTLEGEVHKVLAADVSVRGLMGYV